MSLVAVATLPSTEHPYCAPVSRLVLELSDPDPLFLELALYLIETAGEPRFEKLVRDTPLGLDCGITIHPFRAPIPELDAPVSSPNDDSVAREVDNVRVLLKLALLHRSSPPKLASK
jgi:hypothetical protein